MRKLSMYAFSTVLVLSLFLLTASPALAQDKKSPDKKPELKTKKKTPSPQTEFEKLKDSLDDLLKEAKAMGAKTAKPKSAMGMLKVGVSPVKGTYQFFRHDAKKLPKLFRDFRNYEKLSPDGKAYTALRGLKYIVHSIDAIVTTKVTVKVGLRFAKNVKAMWKMGPAKAIPAAIIKTGVESKDDLKQYIVWAQYSYQLKQTISYIEKNYGRLKNKVKKFVEQVEKIIKQRGLFKLPQKDSKTKKPLKVN